MVEGDIYCTMITDFFFVLTPNNINASDIWFQRGGVTSSHTPNTVIGLWRQMFDCHLISRIGDVSWLPRIFV